MFDSILPESIDWTEVNRFFEDNNSFCRNILLEKWREDTVFQNIHLSDASIKVLECLHNDLSKCYGKIFVRDENGKEDRQEEYRSLRQWLFFKYGSLSERVLIGIYHGYLNADR